jgi:predicted dehydrogenase
MVPAYGGGSLWDVGIYPLSFAQMVYADLPVSVTGQQWIGDTGVDEVFAGQMQYSGVRAAQISSGFHIPYHAGVEIHGTQGRLILTRPFTNMNERDSKMTFTAADGKSKTLRVPKADPYQCEVDNMNDAILDGVLTLVTLAESRRHVQVALALYESARSGQPLSLEFVDGS